MYKINLRLLFGEEEDRKAGDLNTLVVKVLTFLVFLYSDG